MITNKVGLEFEFIITSKKTNEVVFPWNYGRFEMDDYPILCESRVAPSKTREELLGNFFKEWYKMRNLAAKEEVDIEFNGWREISPEISSIILKKMGTKVISETNNIYGTDILTMSDDIIKDGKITGKKISCGLHIHFSSCDENKVHYDETDDALYSRVSIPLTFGKDIELEMNLYKRDEVIKGSKRSVTAKASRITKPVIYHIVKEFDDKMLPTYKLEENLKYRNPGFYELKAHGFEYRSLPFNKTVLNDIDKIVDFAFSLLEDL